MLEHEGKQDVQPRLSLSWQEILAADPDHERHLETTKGRFQAILNLVKNGGMVLEVMQMDRIWQNYKDIATSINGSRGEQLIRSSVVRGHLRRTISPIGAAARSDIDDEDWQLTPFGMETKAVLLFVWQKFLELNVNPVQLLSNRSSVKKNSQGNITTPALTRSGILIDLYPQKQLREVELAEIENINAGNIAKHLSYLQSAELINSKSVDPIDSFSFFRLTTRGGLLGEWPEYVESRGYNLPGLSRGINKIIDDLVIDLIASAAEYFTTEDVMYYGQELHYSKSTENKGNVSGILNFYVREGLLEKSELNGENMSEYSLTELGQVIVKELLNPLYLWAEDLNSIPEINIIRAQLIRNPNAFLAFYRQIGDVYQETSPLKNQSRESKISDILSCIEDNEGNLNASDIGRKLGISTGYTHAIVTSLTKAGKLGYTFGKGGRKYPSIKES